MVSQKRWRLMLAASMLICFFAVPVWAAEAIKIALFDHDPGHSNRPGYICLGPGIFGRRNKRKRWASRRKVKLIEEDSQLKPDVAVRKATKNVLDGVKFLGNRNGNARRPGPAAGCREGKSDLLQLRRGRDEVTGSSAALHLPRFTQHRGALHGHRQFLATKPFRKFYTMNMELCLWP